MSPGRLLLPARLQWAAFGVDLAQLGVLRAYHGGRNWARILLAVLGVLGVLVSQVPLAVGIVVVGAGVLMFLPKSNAWFKGKRR